ncbi:MAG: hypothetical protein GF364_11185 [Candidatus Lokiarchaeota archaeon]|nr:hypothetical protein [Candidatus Lokiarchaeota archaeon]
MRFFEKVNDVDDNFYENYRVLCGIEEEFFIINRKGNLVNAADNLMVEAADILKNDQDLLQSLKIKIRGLDAEPNPAQIEYVTLPLKPENLKEAVQAGRELLIKAAKAIGVKILAQSLHPIESDPHPIVGTHINVSVQKQNNLMLPDEVMNVYNYLWNYLPEIIAVTANSPIYQGKITNISSNRCANSNVLKDNGFAKIKTPDYQPSLVTRRYYGRMRYQLKIGSGEDEFEKKVIANSRGERLVDITPRGPFTNLGDDKDESPTRNRVEVRIVDTQQELDDVLDIAYLCCLSALHAVVLGMSGKILEDPFHYKNLENAIAHGRKARLLRDNNVKQPVKESISAWIDDISIYQNYLNVHFKRIDKEPFEKSREQAQLSIEYKTRKIEKIRQQGKINAVVVLKKTRIIKDNNGNKYKIPSGRQIHGRLLAEYDLSYEEEHGLITYFNAIKVTNFLKVQGLKIRLEPEDKIVSVRTQRQSLFDRLLGGFPF